MLITVDLDLEERRDELGKKPRRVSDLELLMYLSRIAYVCRNTKCRVCKTRKGLHIYIKTEKYNFEHAIGARLYLGDDPIRADIDILRFRKGIVWYIETLFQAKIEKKGISKEVCVDGKAFFETLLRRL